MKTKNLLILTVLACVQSAAIAEKSNTEAGAGKDTTLSDTLATVMQNNPTLKAARSKWEMMKQRIPQVRAWDDLMVGWDVQRMGTTRFDKYTDNEWMALQSIPISGKNLSRARVANFEAMQVFEEFRRSELDVITRAKVAYYKLAGAHLQLKINSRNQELLKQIVDISRAKYEVGTQSQADVLLAQTDLSRLSETRAMLGQEISEQQTQLNVLMDRPTGTPLARPQAPLFKVRDLYSDKLNATALATRPEIVMARHKIEAEKARLQLARRQWIPDPQIQIKARQYEGSSRIQEYDTGIIFSVPWVNYSKYSAGVREAAQSLESAQHEYEAASSAVLGLVRDQMRKIETIAQNYRLYNNQIVPLASQAVQSTRSSYEADKTSFLELITARRALQDADSSAVTYLTSYQVALAELEAIVGSSVPMPKITSNYKPSK
jgi:outer membrane protein, heavy metal efflux system